MKLVIVCFLSLFLMFGCSNNISKPVNTPQAPVPSQPVVEYKVIKLPSWISNIPLGEIGIGFAWNKQYNPDEALNCAKDFAAVSVSRNYSSFVVDKQTIEDFAKSKTIDWTKVNFQVVVSADTTFLRKAGRELKLIDKIELSGMLIGLFAFNEINVNKQLVSMSYDAMPEWSSLDIYDDPNRVYAVGNVVSASLMDSWMEAQKQAIVKIAKYRIQNIVSRIRQDNDFIRTIFRSETATISNQIYFDKAYIYQKKTNQSTSYGVSIMLKSSK